jgi:hypothetical protein
MTEKQRKHFLKTTHRRLPALDNPFGIPTRVLNQLASEQLPDKESYSKRLNELLKAIQQNGDSHG